MSLIKRLEELEAKATPGPWYADTGDSYSPVRSDSGPICDCDVVEYDTEQGKINSLLIEEMRNSITKLLDLVKAVQDNLTIETPAEVLKALAALESFKME